MALPLHILQDPTIEWFVNHCHKKRYPPKSTLIYAGDSSDALFFLISGSVTVLIEDIEGKELVLAYLNPGDFFGEMGLFHESEARSAWVRAKTDCEIAEISYIRFLKLIDEKPDLLMKLTAQIVNRLHRTSRKVGDLAFLDVTGRIARALLDLCHEPDAVSHPNGKQIKITRQELGRIVGCSREMVGRILKVLEEQGHLEASGKTIVVYSVD